MRSQHKHNRRPRGNKPQEDEQYGPSHHRRESSTSSREYYDGYRDPSSHSRSRHDEDPWYPDVGRYREEEVYRRESDYDTDMRRDSDWGARPAGESQYSSMRDDWPPQHYDHPSYHDSSSWGAAASHDAYDGGSPYYRDWSITTSTRGSSSHVRDDDRHLRHGDSHDRESTGWSRDHRRDKGGQQSRYQNDSGWEPRRRDNGWGDGAAEDPQDLEDRQWEPAPSWKSTHRNEGSSQARTQNHNNSQRGSQQQRQQYSKGKKNHSSKQQQRRDWRNDDSNLNNWTRRDYNTQSRKASKNQQQQQPQQRYKQYHSRSRSRSPAESYQSHLSSRGRSRSPSRSPAPKRRRRDSGNLPQSRTPSDRDAPGWVPRQGGSIYSKSPSPHRESKSHCSRRSSVSSVSSATSGHTSRSNSPNARARPVHRLPTSEASATPMDLDGGSRKSQHGNSRQYSSHSNGKYHTNDRPDRPLASDWLPNNSTVDSRYDDAMPPPSIIPPRPSHPPSDIIPPETLPTRVNIASKPNRKPSLGFKPISRAQPIPSSSLRKFFPGDDDDTELSPSVEPPPDSPVVPPRQGYRASTNLTPAGKEVWPPPPEQPEEVQSQPSWSTPEPVVPPHHEPIYNGQHIAKPSTRPPPLDPVRNGNVPERQILPPTSALKDKLRKPTPQKATTPVVLQPTPSPAPSFTIDTPPQLSGIPPPSSSSIVSIANADESQSNKSIPTSGKPVYTILTQVGEGTFGKVYKARNSLSGLLVALKRIRMETEKDGFPVTAMREIKLLQSLRHENIVQLYEMIVSNGSVYMVFEYNHHDLTGILSQTQFEFTEAHLKSLCHQMLAGLAYLHHKGVIHRDIKGSNILINNRGELKLADFGLARFYQKRRRTDYTNRVITLWYRPPELLFGATVYGPEVDMWSAGCIMLELFTRKPVFQGNDEIHQLDVIHKLLGTPTPERWPALVDLPWYELARPREEIPNRFRDIFQKWMTPAALDLAEQLLAYDPLRRLSALQALGTPYFTQEKPPAEPPTGLAALEGEWHELESKRERAKKRKKNEGSA